VNFDSTRSDLIALAKEGCALCHGLGLRRNGKKTDAPCNCVLRSVFRACYKRFRLCASREKHITRVRLEQVNGKDRSNTWGMKDEEFMADFCLVSRRALNDEEYQIFKFHYLLAADWKLCCRRLKMDRGTFFHAVYRIQQKLGHVYRELQPYALFPLDEYFGGIVRTDRVARTGGVLLQMPSIEKRASLRPPLRQVA